MPMVKIEKLISKAKAVTRDKEALEFREVFERMTTKQLEEFLDGDRTDEQLHALLASVDGLHLYRW